MENITINVDPQYKDNQQEATLIIREGQAAPIPSISPLSIAGNIEAPAEYALKRLEQKAIDPSNSHVEIDQQAGTITFIANAQSEVNIVVTGIVQLSPVCVAFLDKEYTSIVELSKFISTNRRYFEATTDATDLAKKLRMFNATVNTVMQDHSDDRSNYTQVASGVVETNLPETIKVKLPITDSVDPVTLTLDLCYTIKESSLLFWFESIDALELFEQYKEKLIKHEANKLNPHFVVIYK